MRYLSKAIAAISVELDGLLIVHLPNGLTEEFSAQVVTEANRLLASSPPYAILVGESDDLSDAECPRVSRKNVIKYRKGRRLAVVGGSAVDLASFDNSYRSIIGPAFPRQSTAQVSIARLSPYLVAELLDALSVHIDDVVQTRCAAALTTAMETTAACYEMSTDTTRAWNGLWFEHVERGLTALGCALQSIADGDGSEPFGAAFERLVCPAFGIPQGDWSEKRAARNFMDALGTYWADGESIEVAVKQLREVVPDDDWTQLPWDRFDEMRLTRESAFGALQSIVAAPETIEVWSRMDRVRFESPVASDQRLLVRTPDGTSACVHGSDGPVLLRLGAMSGVMRSQDVEVLVPYQGTIDHHSLPDVSLTTSRTTLKFVCAERRLAAGHVVLSGFLESGVGGSSRKPIKAKLSVKVDAASPIVGNVAIHADTDLVLTTSSVGALAWPSKARLGGHTYCGPANALEESSETQLSKDLTQDGPHLVAVWGDGSTSANVDLIERADGEFYLGQLPTGLSLEVTASGVDLALRVPTGAKGYVTPLTAAVHKEAIDRSPLDERTTSSVRGQLEELFAKVNEDSGLMEVLGHVVLPEGEAADPHLSVSHELGIAGPAEFLNKWHMASGFSVPDSHRECDEAVRFRTAFLALTRARLPRDQGAWASRAAWAHLRDKDAALLDGYLNAYADLVRVSRDASPMVRFWACFPFSASVWDGHKFKAVLVSPLHPLRLAWLASAEKVLKEADHAEQLAGTVEGWRFPLVGPAPTPVGSLVAIPSDPGEAQVFAAWSLMVPLSPDDNRELRAPERVMGRPAPGSSPSGLTASAAEAALRDFTRSNPYVSSLTIDLAAGAPSPRLSEIDQAVIATIEHWGKTANRWGVRVMDSLHRTGDIPRSKLAAMVDGKGDSCTVTWSRYRPENGASPHSNIRLLQDSGATLRATDGKSPQQQVTGAWPLRRFSCGDTLGENEVFTSTVLEPTGWLAFDRAIEAMEGTPKPIDLGMRLSQSYLVDRTADWTVSGEAFLSPSSLASLVAGTGQSETDRVLWEWRPPFLQGKHGGQIDRRPYVTVARVSPSLRNNLTAKVKEVTGWAEPQLGATVTRILRRLGTRGLGLSSLLTRGGTHESGALGFFLAYELLDLAASADAVDVVLPLDACDTFLTALGGGPAGNAAKRADLLVIRLSGRGAVLVPIEIKFYGVEAATAVGLPKPGPALKEPLGQLGETTRSLSKMLDHAGRLRGADRTLWRTAFATLVESGLQLGSPQLAPAQVSELLTSLIRGDLDVRLGHPLITYFQHAPDGEGYQTYLGETHLESRYGAFISRPRTAFNQLLDDAEGGQGLTTQFRSLMDWATSDDTAEPSGHVPDLSPPSSPHSATDEGVEPAGHDAVEGPEPTSQPDADREASQDAAVSIEPNVPALAEWKNDYLGEEMGIRADGIRFPVGEYVGSLGAATPEFWPANTSLNQLNIGVVGDLGTGKTQLLQSLVYNLRRTAPAAQSQPVNFLVFDYKRDFQKDAFLKKVGGTVLRPHNIPLNPFSLTGGYSRLAAYERAREFCDVLERIYSGVGPVQRERLTTAIMDAFEDRRGGPTLSEVYDRYRDGAKADSVTSILSSFVMREVFIEDRGEALTFDELLNDQVVVIALNELGNDQDGKNALVALLLNEYYAYMQRLPKKEPVGTDPSLRFVTSYLLVDEATNIMKYDFDVLMNILLQGREFGVGVMLSSQFLSHFRTRQHDWTEPLLTWFLHKVPYATAKDLERIGMAPAQSLAEQLGHLHVHEALYKSLGETGRRIRGAPFFELMAEQGDSLSE